MPAKPTVIPFPGGARTECPPLLALDKICLRRSGMPLLDCVSFSTQSTGITALLGPNGAGKSLLLRVIAGLIPPDSGNLLLDESTGAPGLVFQRPVLLSRSVKSNLSHALRLAGVPRRARTGRLAHLLVLGGLSDRAHAPARDLSGGEAQRLAIVRALASRPRLLLMDEPCSHLDPKATAEIETLTRSTAADGVKIIFVTHDRAQAMRLAHDVAFLDRGRIVEHRPARDFFARPRSGPARAYLAGRLDQ